MLEQQQQSEIGSALHQAEIGCEIAHRNWRFSQPARRIFLMCRTGVICSIMLFLWVNSAAAQTPDPSNIQHVVDTMVRLCIAGGSAQAVSGGAEGGADISLRTLDITGNLKGEFKINKSNAEGLVNGINNALTQVAADQADKVRDCLKPVRDRLLDVMLPVPRTETPPAPHSGANVAAAYAIQDLYETLGKPTDTTTCGEVVATIQKIKPFYRIADPAPKNFYVQYPTTITNPTIADLAHDRISRLRSFFPNCVR